MEDKLLVSVIIPVFNNAEFLAEAIESVLAQSYRPSEIIVVDDGSTDCSAAIAKGFGSALRYCFQSNMGAGGARNLGISLAQGKWLAFLDADDFWEKDKLSVQAAAVEADPALDMVFGHVRQFYNPGLHEHIRKLIKIPAEIMPGLLAGSMLINRDAFLRVGMFRTDCIVGEFIDWHDRATRLQLKSRMLGDVVLNRRIHMNSLSVRERRHQTDFVRILKESLDRRRRDNPRR